MDKRDAKEVRKPVPVRPGSRPEAGGGVIRWVVIVSIVALVLSMFLPVILSLAMRLEIHATRDVTPLEMAQNYAMPGAIKEKLDTVTSTDYLATFVPSRLTNRTFQFTWLEIFYGPILLTGTSIDLVPNVETRGQGFTGYASMMLSGSGPVIMFFVLLVALLVVLQWSYKNPNQVLGYVMGLTITWLIYTLIISLLARWLTSPANSVLNQVLGRESNPLSFAPPIWDVLDAPVRVFVVGMVYWVLTFLGRRAKMEASNDIRKFSKMPVPTPPAP